MIVNCVFQEKGVKRMTILVQVLVQIYHFFICEVPVQWHIRAIYTGENKTRLR